VTPVIVFILPADSRKFEFRIIGKKPMVTLSAFVGYEMSGNRNPRLKQNSRGCGKWPISDPTEAELVVE
jgi:hypothetical protein